MPRKPIEKAVAAKLVDAIEECNRTIDRAEVVAREIEDAEERNRVRKAIMQAGSVLYVEVVFGISNDYPDLDPVRKLYKKSTNSSRRAVRRGKRER